jgi:hypothetical protein
MTKRDLTAETAEDKFDVEAEARRRGIEPYQVRATGAVNDRLIADIVSDFRRPIGQSSSLIPPSREREPAKPKGTGWVDPAPLVPPRGLWRETEDEKRSRIAAQQAAELAEIEARTSSKTPHEAATEYNPLDNSRLKE